MPKATMLWKLSVKSKVTPLVPVSENGALAHFSRGAEIFRAQTIVIITADCALMLRQEIDRVVDAFIDPKAHCISNTLTRSHPRGFEVEVFSWECLWKMHETATELACREHIAGETYSSSNIRVIHSGEGLHPEKYKDILGLKAGQDLKLGQPLNFNHIAH